MLEDDDDGNNKSTKQNSKTVAMWKLDKQSQVPSLRTKTLLVFNCSQYVPLQGCCLEFQLASGKASSRG
jgi:hypothetical protein